MAYIKKAEREAAKEQSTLTDQPAVVTAYSLARQEGGYWSYVKWEITEDGKASAVEVSVPDLYPITADKIERAFVQESQK